MNGALEFPHRGWSSSGLGSGLMKLLPSLLHELVRGGREAAWPSPNRLFFHPLIGTPDFFPWMNVSPNKFVFVELSWRLWSVISSFLSEPFSLFLTMYSSRLSPLRLMSQNR